MNKIQKFLQHLTKKERTYLFAVLEDIRNGKIGSYDIKVLTGYKGLFRLWKGSIRIIFSKGPLLWRIVDIAYRKDAYKNL